MAARLLALSLQAKDIDAEIKLLKENLEQLHEANALATKTDLPMLFTDGSTQTVRLQRVMTGTYFKVSGEHKDDYSLESQKLQQKYLKAGKAEMAQKAPTWKVQIVSG